MNRDAVVSSREPQAPIEAPGGSRSAELVTVSTFPSNRVSDLLVFFDNSAGVRGRAIPANWHLTI